MKKSALSYLHRGIKIPSQIQIYNEETKLHINGSLGWTGLDIGSLLPFGSKGIKLNSKTNQLHLLYPQRIKKVKTFCGTSSSLIQNQCLGVQEGHMVFLKLQGLGYKVSICEMYQQKKKVNLPRIFEKRLTSFNLTSSITAKSQTLILDLGFSHLISYRLPREVLGFLIKPTIFCLFSLDKSLVHQIAAEIRNYKTPEAYTGKGISYLDEFIKLKPGKKS